MEEVTDVTGNGFTGSIMQADSRDVKGWGGVGVLHRVRVQASCVNHAA